MAIYRPFDLSKVPTISRECRAHAKMFMESLERFELWALKCE